ncbi:MAG: hypothetical protein JWO07_8, partial [Candidatus Saccharibacteria bacterium]|nr:hypothetical protein [Candidatus Saccharibacteria bacterium]
SDTPVPETYDEFKEYWDDTVEHELEMTPAATQAIVQALGGEAPRPAFIPEQLWPMLEVPVMPVANHLKLLTIGELPPRVRERFHLPFSHMDKARLNLFRAAVASTDLLPIPDKIKYHPRAYAGLQRLRQQ